MVAERAVDPSGVNDTGVRPSWQKEHDSILLEKMFGMPPGKAPVWLPNRKSLEWRASRGISRSGARMPIPIIGVVIKRHAAGMSVLPSVLECSSGFEGEKHGGGDARQFVGGEVVQLNERVSALAIVRVLTRSQHCGRFP